MPARQLLSLHLALVLLAAGLAGCAGDGAPAPAEPSANESLAPEAPVDDGSAEMATSLGHMPHLHDYWMGKERVTIMDEEVRVDEFTALFFTFFDVFRGTPGVGGTFFRLPEGALVYEGTGKMEITATWTDPTVTGAGLSWRSPADESFSAQAPLQQGTALSIDVTPAMTDMPHDKESRWAFLVTPASPGQVIVGSIHFRIEIVRMHDIATFPAHPELFGGASTLTLYDGAATSRSQNFATRIVGFMTDNEQESGVRSSEVVPMETLSMTANVSITSATSNIGEVTSVELLYGPAGSFGSYRAQVLSADPSSGVYQFGWPVEMSQTDSPYAKTSQWTFDLLIRTDPTGTGETSGMGLTDAQVDYHLTVVAYDALLEGIEPPADEDD